MPRFKYISRVMRIFKMYDKAVRVEMISFQLKDSVQLCLKEITAPLIGNVYSMF